MDHLIFQFAKCVGLCEFSLIEIAKCLVVVELYSLKIGCSNEVSWSERGSVGSGRGPSISLERYKYIGLIVWII